jgi:hypothetical protein
MAIGTFREWIKEQELLEAEKPKLPIDILDKFLAKYNTEGIDKIIIEIWNKLSESKQKIIIGVPGIKGNINPKIHKSYKTDAKIKRDDKKYIGVVYDFEYQGLGNHPSNRSQTEIGISTNYDETELIMFSGISVQYARIKINLSKSLYKDLL